MGNTLLFLILLLPTREDWNLRSNNTQGVFIHIHLYDDVEDITFPLFFMNFSRWNGGIENNFIEMDIVKDSIDTELSVGWSVLSFD